MNTVIPRLQVALLLVLFCSGIAQGVGRQISGCTFFPKMLS
jgi:hypothetical protein